MKMKAKPKFVAGLAASGLLALALPSLAVGQDAPAFSVGFSNEAGYVVKYTLVYLTKKNVGGQMIPMPTVQSADVTFGISVALKIPAGATDVSFRVEQVGKGGYLIDDHPTGASCYIARGTVFTATYAKVSCAGNWSANKKLGAALNTPFVGTPVSNRGIRFKNAAGYVSWMTVTYWTNLQSGAQTVPIPKTVSTGNITVGLERTIEIPADVLADRPITVAIGGVAVPNKTTVYSTTLNAGFTGEQCFKSTGTIFTAGGSAC